MDTVHGTYQGGRVELDAAVDWPEGVRVAITPTVGDYGFPESNWPTTPEGIRQFLASLDEIEPLELTPEDEAEVAAAREEVRQAGIAAVRKQMGLQL
jgi:hypothetical protein